MQIRTLVVAGFVASLGCNVTPEPEGLQGTPVIREAAMESASTPEGALVAVSMNSTVGVVLDEIPQSMRNRVAASLISKPASFWTERAKMQTRLTTYRLVFREFFYGGKKQLPLPPENLWSFQLTSTPVRTTIDGHDVVTVTYQFSSTLLTDAASPKVSENKLAKVGGIWSEPFTFPVDPELLYQRTRYACMDEEDFPEDSVDSEEVDSFYDQDCGPESTLSPHGQCHQTELTSISCRDALVQKVGKIDTTLDFTRIAWSQAVADSVRVYPPTSEHADLEVYLEDFLINRIEYKWFEPNSCEEQEHCIGAPGWRRVLQFNSSDQNRGKNTLDIGDIDYYLSGKETLNETYNIFDFHACHAHYHFAHYGSFSFDAPGANVTNKQGFCLQSTNRAANHEFSPLHNPYGGCDYQGVAAGWVDQYKIGLPCQWVDVTNVDTATQPVTADLTFSSNPDGFLCEGEQVLDSKGDPVFEPTEFTNEDGELRWRPKCNFTEGWDTNNSHSYAVTVPAPGVTYVNQACTRGQVGPLRNCGLKLAQEKLTCNPGQPVTLRCTVAAPLPPQVARVCERSTVLNTSMACIERTALASVAVDGVAEFTTTCPAARGLGEFGGEISIFTGAVFPDDLTAGLNCAVVP